MAFSYHFSIYLPAIPDYVPEQQIIESLKSMGRIHHVDAVETYNQINKKDCFVHFYHLYDTKQNQSMLQLLNKGKCVQYVYCDRPLKFWNIFKNTSKRQQPSVKVKETKKEVPKVKEKEKEKEKQKAKEKDNSVQIVSLQKKPPNSYFAALMKQEKTDVPLTKKDCRNIFEFEKSLQKEQEMKNDIENDMEHFLDEIDAVDEFLFHQKMNDQYYDYVQNMDKMRILMTANEGEIMVSNIF